MMAMVAIALTSRNGGVHRLIVRLSIGALLGALGVACQPPDDDAGPWRMVADNVGDTVVARLVGSTEQAVMTLVPEVRIGVADGDSLYAFGTVSGLAPSADDGVYVWDELVKAVRQYDREGRFVRQVGSAGHGPGEYQSIAGMALVAGRLVFFDRSTQHVSVYDSAGTLAATWQPVFPRGPMGQLYPGIGERFYLYHLTESPQVSGGRGLQIAYIGYDVRGAATGDTVPRVVFGRDQGPPTIRASGQRMGRQVMTVDMVPFTSEPVATFSPHGYVVSGKGDRYAILLARRDAPPLRIERETTPVPVSDEERADAEALVVAKMRTIDPRWTWSGDAIPSHKPFFRRVRVDADGRIWVERHGPSVRVPDDVLASREGEQSSIWGELPPSRWREPIVYDVFGADGGFLGTVPVPERVSLRHMQGNTVWGVVRDSLDIEYVVRWRLEPPGTTARPTLAPATGR